jgi:hypothetical protein
MLTKRERNNIAAKKYRKSHPERRRFIQAPKRGTTKTLVDAKLLEQKNKCAICKEFFIKTPHIDHDHLTNNFRGLLCRACNHMLGNARDRIAVLQNAIQYLKMHGVSDGREEASVQSHSD